MKYNLSKSHKIQRRETLFNRAKLSAMPLLAVFVVLGGSFSLNVASAKGGVDTGTGTGAGTGAVVDTSICNTLNTVVNYNATFPAGTIKAKVTPEFSITGTSVCPVAFTARFVSVTTAYTYDYINNAYVLAELPNYPITETRKDVVIRPGAFAIKNRISDKPVNDVYQMFTEVRMYPSSSFDSTGKLLPSAVLLGTDVANWTQTNWVTF